jgi:hypothetical protein
MAPLQRPPTFAKVSTGSKEYSLEINDANFETKSWRLPRYEGSKTITTTLNKYSDNDITFGKTAAVQNYSRNIYIGNAVIGMEDNGSEDSTLINIPAFAYATTNRYITVNNDETISDNKIETTKTNFDSKRGFYRAFYEDFPIGSDCKIIINDESIRTSLKDNYNIYFNGGQLEKLISMTFPSTGFEITQDQNSLYKIQQNLSSKFSTIVKFFNKNELRDFYTGSLDDIDGDTANLNIIQLGSFITPFFKDFKNNSEYIGDKRMFLSFCTQSGTPLTPSNGNEFEPIRTTDKDGTPLSGGGGIIVLNPGITKPTRNLSEISTTEVIDITTIGTGLAGSSLTFNTTYLFPLNQIYHPGSLTNNGGFGGFATTEINHTPSAFSGGTLLINKCDDATPSLLLNLPKNEHLPDGVGQKSFVIIPENLHPHIKRNLTHFLAKAGISLGVDKIPNLDTTFEQLK